MAKKSAGSKKGGHTGKLAIILGVLVALYFLKDCLPGFGLGGGPSAGLSEGEPSAEPSASAAPTVTATASASATAAPAHRIAVKGSQCFDPDERSCEDACKRASEQDGPVIIVATEGSQGVVEELEKCLKTAEKTVSIEEK